ncbi:hypothetical protein EYF80_062624 [Liparis tanakae]|uniref:Uncharacterized protein n=1 Tax=Liparis tanakae TaxID=230148 RepID=A0A4Z2EEV2_9TELE|nr:hypothetical protein EYF80_062624 [Liparis tanakae]
MRGQHDAGTNGSDTDGTPRLQKSRGPVSLVSNPSETPSERTSLGEVMLGNQAAPPRRNTHVRSHEGSHWSQRTRVQRSRGQRREVRPKGHEARGGR